MDTRVETVLTAQDHTQFLDEGYVLLRGIIEPSVVTCALGQLSGDADPETKAEAARSCVTERLLAAVNELQGKDNPVSGRPWAADMPREHTPEAIRFVNPHMDLIHPTFMPDGWAVGAFIFLTPVRHRGGAFMYGPQSPWKLRAQMSRDSGESAWGSTKSESVAGIVRECLAEPGDVILFQHTMLHSFSPNTDDPTTRHALRVSFPTPRIHPGDKSFDQMSTVEKANSPGYMRLKYGDHFTPIDPGEPSTLQCVAHDLLHFQGRTHRFWVEAHDRTVIRTAVSADLETWDETEPLTLVSDVVRAIHLEHRFNPTLTVVCDTGGGRSWSRVYESADLVRWRQISGMPEMTLSRPHFVQEQQVGPFTSKAAYASITYFVSDDRPNQIWWRCGGNREEFSCWRDQGLAAIAEGRVTDIQGRPSLNAGTHTLVADIDGAAHYVTSAFIDEFDAPMTAFTSDGMISQVRVFERAQSYWLVTFVRDGRMLWGEIDWAARPGHIEVITARKGLRRALQIVGMA